MTLDARRAQRALRRAVDASLPDVGLESLESRRLLAVDFNFHFYDPGDAHAEFHDEILKVMEAAGDAWSQHFDSTATIEVEIQFDDVSDALAYAQSPHFEKVTTRVSDDVDIMETGVMFEIRTGGTPGGSVDPNGQIPDAAITWATALLSKTSFETGVGRPLPEGKFDALSIATHELGHVLGFFNLSFDDGRPVFDPETQRFQTSVIESLFQPGGFGFESDGSFQIFDFTGAVAKSVYGDDVPMTLKSGAHYGTRAVDHPLANFLMDPYSSLTSITEVSAIDIAILADLGMPVVDEFPVTPTNGPVLKIAGTSANDVIEVIFTGNQYVVKRNFVTQTQTFDAADFTSVLIETLGGDDSITLSGSLPGVSVNAGDGNDTIVGGYGSESLNGAGGNDRVFGNSGNDVVIGGSGTDRLFGGTGSDRVFGNGGNDYLEGSNGDDTLEGGDGDDEMTGGGGNDVFFGLQGSDSMNGGTGNDRLNGGGRGDLFIGGGGRDTVDYSDRTANLFLTLNGIMDDGEAGEEDNLLSGIEVLVGGTGDDKIGGDGLANTLGGGDGKDTIEGGSGDDYIEGNAGADVLDGSSGNDLIVGGGGNDRIVGGSGRDNTFGGAGNDRMLDADRFGDAVDGGQGTDFAQIDQRDTISGIEDDDLINVA